jgi:hypothetical protein
MLLLLLLLLLCSGVFFVDRRHTDRFSADYATSLGCPDGLFALLLLLLLLLLLQFVVVVVVVVVSN